MEETGSFTPGSDYQTGSIKQEGSYKYVGDDGNTYQITYVADERGYQPQGQHLPRAPQQIKEYAELQQKFPELFTPKTGGSDGSYKPYTPQPQNGGSDDSYQQPQPQNGGSDGSYNPYPPRYN